MNDSPIGVFDSGMGGLSVWRELRALMPHESIVYFGDGKNCPYGEKDDAEVLRYIDDAVKQLLARGVKLVVLACNTATMIAIKYLRENYDIPFVGMEPAIKPAANSTDSGVVGVLATRASLDSEWFNALKEKYSDRVRIVTSVGEGFVRAVESGAEDTPETMECVERAVRPLVDAGSDHIVLGCTHYPFLRAQIEAVVGKDVEIIDPAPAVARRVKWLLDEYGLNAAAGHIAAYDFMTASDEAYLERLVAKAEKSDRAF